MNLLQSLRSGGRLVLLAVAAMGLCVAQGARADTVLLSQTNLILGTESIVTPFTVASPGTLTVSLSNIAWPQSLESLSIMLSSSDQVIFSWGTDGSATETYNITPGTYFAHVSGTAAGFLNIGLYSVNVSFQPAGVVPLPAPAWLLMFGIAALAGLAWHLRRFEGRLVSDARSASG